MKLGWPARCIGMAAFVLSIMAILPEDGRGFAADFSFNPVADSYVSGDHPDRNAGNSRILRIASSSASFAVVKFHVSGLTGPVEKATLSFYNTTSSNAGFEVHQMDSTAWQEKSVTFATAPSVGAMIDSSDQTRKKTWTRLDVTSAVKSDGTYSFMLVPDSSSFVTLASRESKHSPVLAIKLASPGSSSTTTRSAVTPSPSPTGSLPPTTTTPDLSVTPNLLSTPIRAAFYYPWFPESWTQSGTFPYTNYEPSLGFYSSADMATIRNQIAAMQYGKISVGISSWWGQGHRTDSRVPTLLSAANGTGFQWTLYYEDESLGDPTVAQIHDDLAYISNNYASDSSYLKIDGRFVVFVYADANDGCAMVDRWREANVGVNAYIVLKVFSGYQNCSSQPDSWHQYSPAVESDSQAGYSYSISPGFWLKGQAPRLTRDLVRWQQNVRDMVSSGAQFQLITTFNEWGEGTSVESATQWSSASGFGSYLDVLHNDGLSPTNPTATPASTPTPGTTAQSFEAVLLAVGDIASCSSSGDEAVAELLNTLLGEIATLGDTVYESGSASEFANCFDPSFGNLKARIHPAVGNHEYGTPGAAGYFDYFGAAAGDPSRGYYSYDLGSWHIVVLNSNCGEIGGCSKGSPQELWLQSDLAAHANSCKLAYWHHARFSSGEHGDHPSLRDLWKTLMDYGTSVVLSGHDHDYERFANMDQDGNPTANGIRQFVVGTGGKSHYAISSPPSTSEVQNDDTYGVLRLTLNPDSYTWSFIPVAGGQFTDTGSAPCLH